MKKKKIGDLLRLTIETFLNNKLFLFSLILTVKLSIILCLLSVEVVFVCAYNFYIYTLEKVPTM